MQFAIKRFLHSVIVAIVLFSSFGGNAFSYEGYVTTDIGNLAFKQEIMIPIDTIPINVNSNFFLTTLLSITIEGNDRAVTLIMKARIVPIPTPFPINASAMGMVPKISAYIGIPTIAAIITLNGLLLPNIELIIFSGI